MWGFFCLFAEYKATELYLHFPVHTVKMVLGITKYPSDSILFSQWLLLSLAHVINYFLCDNPTQQQQQNLDYLGKQSCWIKDWFLFSSKSFMTFSRKACSKMENGFCGIGIFYWCGIYVATAQLGNCNLSTFVPTSSMKYFSNALCCSVSGDPVTLSKTSMLVRYLFAWVVLK